MFKIDKKDFSDGCFSKSYHIIKKAKKILVWGDEDSDGITATIVLLRSLKKINKKVEYFIPSRELDGIGLTEKKLSYFLKKDYDTFVTVDCGSVNSSQIEMIKKNKKNIVVTDHHIPYKKLIKDVPYINTHLLSSKKFKNLSGCGVSFIFSLFLLKKFKVYDNFIESFFNDPLSLSLTAIGTFCDKVKIGGLNEYFMRYLDGILYNLPYLKEVHFDNDNICGLFGNSKTEGLKNPIVEFFISEKFDSTFYEYLKKSRKKSIIFQKNLEKNIKMFEDKNFENKKIIVLLKKDIEYKYIGMTASILSKKLDKPVCVIGKRGKTLSGECRFNGKRFNWLNILKFFKDYFENYGGHKQAAGFSIKEENVNEFIDKFNLKYNASE